MTELSVRTGPGRDNRASDARSVGGTAVTRIACVIVAGLAIGALTSIGQTYLSGPPEAFVNSASAWLVAPFVVGAWMPTRSRAAIGGLAVCVLQLVGYYATAHLRGYATSHALIAFWLVCALLGGPIFGVAGRLWREGKPPLRGLGMAILAASFLAEGLWVYHHELGYNGTAALWIGIGVVLTAVLTRSARDLVWLPPTLAVAIAAEAILNRIYAQTF